MTHGDLFAGIGGFALAAQWCGLETKWAVEIDPYCQRVYRKQFPDVEVYGDVRSIRSIPYVDLITAGFPCQPVSVAGKGLGTDDPRWMWPDTIRIICLVRPRWVLLENVPGLLGREMSDVLRDLAASGYDAEWQVLSAGTFGARHRRRRLWVVAYANSGALREQSRWRGWSRWAHPLQPTEPWDWAPRRLGAYDGVPARVDRLRALGNAIVPQVAAWIIQQIVRADFDARLR